MKYLINPYLSTEYIDYEDDLDNLELIKNKIHYKTIVTEKVNAREYFPEPNTPGIDRYSPGADKIINFKNDNEDFEDELKNKEIKELKDLLIMKKRPSLINTNLIVSEAI